MGFVRSFRNEKKYPQAATYHAYNLLLRLSEMEKCTSIYHCLVLKLAAAISILILGAPGILSADHELDESSCQKTQEDTTRPIIDLEYSCRED